MRVVNTCTCCIIINIILNINIILQAGKSIQIRLRQKIGAGRKQLSQFNKSRT